MIVRSPRPVVEPVMKIKASLDTLVVVLELDAVVDTRNGLDSMEHYQVGVAADIQEAGGRRATLDVLDVVAPAMWLPDAQVLQPKW